MLIIGIILTVLGFIVFQWAAKAQGGSVLDRPLIFNNVVAVLVINLLWVGLFAGGFYSLWQVNPIIVLTIFGIYAVLWILGRILGSEKAKAKKIFKLYKQLKLFRPKATDEELFREMARAYFSGLRWDEQQIRMTVDAIFEERAGNKENKDIKDVASSILIFENPSGDFMGGDFMRSMKQLSKKQKAIEKAYEVVLGKTEEVTERPELSKNTMEWIKSVGLNPDDMSDQQLAVFAEIDDYGKSNWIVRFLYTISFAFVILALINLLTLDIITVVIHVVIAFVVWYIGHKIQMRRISKKFSEASILQYAREQQEQEDDTGSNTKDEIENWLNERSTLASEVKEAFANGEYEKTLELSEKILSMNEGDFNALSFKATALAKLKQYEEAIEVLDRCIKENGKVFFLWVTRGDCYYHLGDFEKAFNDYMVSLVLEPDNTAVVDKVARTLFRHGDTKRAIDYAKKAINTKESPEPFLVMATMLFEKGYANYANEIIRMGAKAFPDDTRFSDFSAS